MVNLAASGVEPVETPHFNKKTFDRAIRYIFNKKGYKSEMLSEEPLRKLINETNRILSSPLTDNLVPDVMLEKLRKDVFVFSGCKTHLELKEVSNLLLDGNGKIKPFQKFSQEVLSIHKTYNQNYLEAEHIFAVSAAESAARWNEYEADGDRYNLQYRTASDDRVRDEHFALHNTTLPVDDPFWNSYFPPNGWRCRCVAVQVRKGKFDVSNSAEAMAKGKKATTQIGKNGQNRSEMFRFNPGKMAVIFPPNHPYYKVKAGIANILNSIETTKLKLIEKRKEDYLKLKKDSNYYDVAFNEENGGLKATHFEHQFDLIRGNYEKDAHDVLFQNGYKSILGSEKGFSVKHVEGHLNDHPFEIKTLIGNSFLTIPRKIAESVVKDAEICVLNFPNNNFSMQKLRKGLDAYHGEMPDLIVISNNQIVYKKTRRLL